MIKPAAQELKFDSHRLPLAPHLFRGNAIRKLSSHPLDHKTQLPRHFPEQQHHSLLVHRLQKHRPPHQRQAALLPQPFAAAAPLPPLLCLFKNHPGHTLQVAKIAEKPLPPRPPPVKLLPRRPPIRQRHEQPVIRQNLARSRYEVPPIQPRPRHALQNLLKRRHHRLNPRFLGPQRIRICCLFFRLLSDFAVRNFKSEILPFLRLFFAFSCPARPPQLTSCRLLVCHFAHLLIFHLIHSTRRPAATAAIDTNCLS